MSVPERIATQPGRAVLLAIAIAAFVVPGLLRADLKRAMSETNLEKRSGLALDNAGLALKAAHDAYDKGDSQLLAQSVAEIKDSVDLAYKSLVDSGKNPRKSVWFKKAEISTRDLARKLDSFGDQMSYTERGILDQVKATVQKVHEELLLGVMEGKKK